MTAIAIQDAVVIGPARAKCSRTGQWTLVCDVQLATTSTPIGGTPRSPGTVQLRKAFGAGEAAAVACQRRAQQMRPGVRVHLAAQGATGRIVLDGVTDLRLPDLNDFHDKVSP